ncbi:hypothetical protein HMI55_004143 [Coelomomyces lativittatus]|nr:hypothetical protein HMI55_004143 [Coelomomyces lativittatus]
MYKFISVDFQSCLRWLSKTSSSSTTLSNHPTSPSSTSSRALVLCIGGAEESLLTQPGNVYLVLKKRRGFIKLALISGSALVPVFSFGENDCFQPYSIQSNPYFNHLLHCIKHWFGWTFPLCHGRFWLFLPFRKRIVTVVGTPIFVPRVPNPSPELIETYHAKYIQGLTELWETFKHKYSHQPNAELKFT